MTEDVEQTEAPVAIKYSDAYKEACFFVWYQNRGKTKFHANDGFPPSDDGKIPSLTTVLKWRNGLGWVERADAMDGEVSRNMEKDAIKMKAEAIKKLAKVAETIVDEGVQFIKENMKPDEFLLFEGYLTPLTIYTGRGFVMPAVLADDAIREDIRRIGFANTMREYRVKYLFTPNEQPFYLDYAPLFEETKLLEPSGQNFNRNILIYKTIGVADRRLKEDLRQVEEIERKYRIREKFVLEHQIGKMKFYSFKD